MIGYSNIPHIQTGSVSGGIMHHYTLSYVKFVACFVNLDNSLAGRELILTLTFDPYDLNKKS